MKSTVYEAAGGHQAFVELARAWHARCLADPIVSHAFSHGYHPQHSERLAAYWAEAMGGPPSTPTPSAGTDCLRAWRVGGSPAWRVNATLNVLAELPTRCD
jgi:hemoglobin